MVAGADCESAAAALPEHDHGGGAFAWVDPPLTTVRGSESGSRGVGGSGASWVETYGADEEEAGLGVKLGGRKERLFGALARALTYAVPCGELRLCGRFRNGWIINSLMLSHEA